MSQLTVREFFNKFPNDDVCLEHIFTSRFGQGHTCPKCEKGSNWYKIKAERAYSCQWCGHHLHPTAGTPFQKSRTPLQLWFYAIYLFTTTRHGVSAKELQRQLGVTYKTAWRMGHEIRKHMAEIDGEGPLDGHIEIDETYVGGKSKQRGLSGKDSNKTPLMGMVSRGGELITQVIPDNKKATLLPIVEKNVVKGSTVSTDQLHSYKSLSAMGYTHKAVSHNKNQWVNGIHHTNAIEGFWGCLKNGIRGTHVHVSRKYLANYAKEFEYRYNSRKTPSLMFPELISTYPERSC